MKYVQTNVVNKDLFHFYIRCWHWLSLCFLAFPMNEKKHFTYFLKKIKFQQGKMTANGHFAVKISSLDTYFWSTNTTIAEMTAPANTIPPKTPTISPDRGKSIMKTCLNKGFLMHWCNEPWHVQLKHQQSFQAKPQQKQQLKYENINS